MPAKADAPVRRAKGWFYALPLAVAAFILWDAAQAYVRGFTGHTTVGLLVLSGAWILAAAVLWRLRARPRIAPVIPNVALFSLMAFFCFIVIEAAISVLFPVFRTGLAHIFRPPRLKIELRENPLPKAGRKQTTFFTTNELGMRGPPLNEKRGSEIVLAIGGSTTECFSLDDQQQWPYLVMHALVQANGKRVWLQNSGLSGHTSSDHLYMLRTNPVSQEAGLILFLVGVNDLSAALAFQGKSADADVERLAQENFSVFPLYTRSATYKLLKFMTAAKSQLRYDMADFYDGMRKLRRESHIVPAPDLQTDVRQYGERIRRICRECKAMGRRCVMITQPAIWRADLGPQEISALWLGGVGPIEKSHIGYLAPGDLQQAMTAFNNELLAAAKSEGVESFDLEPLVPKTLDNFYDDVHYTAAGSRIVAEQIARYLAGRSAMLR